MSSLVDIAATSRSPISTWPAVGSISRVRHRTSVDLPEPDSPITTKTSPGATSKETSLTAAMQPVFSSISARLMSASGVPMIWSAFGPKTFQRSLTASAGLTVLVVVDPGVRVGGLGHRMPSLLKVGAGLAVLG